MNVRSATLLLIASLALLAGCDNEEDVPTASSETVPTKSIEAASSLPTASRSAIPNDVLLAELRALPVYPGSSPGDEAYPEGFAFSGAAGRDFTVHATVEDIVNFYHDALGAERWISEGEPRDETFEPDGSGATYRRVSSSFIKGDLRLLLGVDPTPKGAAAGVLDYGLGIQPIWYPTDTTPVQASASPVDLDLLGLDE